MAAHSVCQLLTAIVPSAVCSVAGLNWGIVGGRSVGSALYTRSESVVLAPLNQPGKMFVSSA